MSVIGFGMPVKLGQAVLNVEGTPERVAEMYDYFHGTLQEIVDPLLRVAEVNQ